MLLWDPLLRNPHVKVFTRRCNETVNLLEKLRTKVLRKHSNVFARIDVRPTKQFGIWNIKAALFKLQL